MKKAYVKPGICVESFALSQSIANSCGVGSNHTTLGKPTYASPATCGWEIGGDTIWLEGTICNDWADIDDQIDAGCYNGPAGDFQLFAS